MAQLAVPGAVYEWQSEDGTLVELFLQASPRGLSDRERGWLEAQRRAWLSIWEVQGVTPGVAVTLRDLFTGEERRVHEQGGSRTLSPRDGALARVVDFEGLSVFCGVHPRMLPPRPVTTVVSALRKTLRFGSKTISVERLRANVPLVGWILAWEEVVHHHDIERTRIPKLQNTDGDPLLLTNDRFDFDAESRPRLEALIAEMAEPQDDEADPVTERVFVQRPSRPRAPDQFRPGVGGKPLRCCARPDQ